MRPKLAISLNASTEEQRRALMPITRKYHLKDLIAACRTYPLRPWEKLTFEYVLLKGVNDTDADARRVVKLLAHLNAKVNLIALNPGPGIRFRNPRPLPRRRIPGHRKTIDALLPPQTPRPRRLRRLRPTKAHGAATEGSGGCLYYDVPLIFPVRRENIEFVMPRSLIIRREHQRPSVGRKFRE